MFIYFIEASTEWISKPKWSQVTISVLILKYIRFYVNYTKDVLAYAN